ncbi:MAG TPA: 3-deoxy-D-manno-octulosonic acid transferase, partial [Hyphomonadaceae bacterium]|nr:3-deoxy-D-manno-octulosonic acid transferase [Hyphomonadaceae bacterium]
MTLGLVTYRTLTAGLDPFLPLILNSRVKRGKENPDRLQERRGYASRKRSAGTLVWMHGASIGESQVLTLLYEALKESAPDLHAVITTQTQTSAGLIARKNLPDLVHQMAPIDTPFATERFLKHWQPDLAIIAEGDIWPNMLSKLDKKRIPRMLVNARMTEKSLQGWERYPKL